MGRDVRRHSDGDAAGAVDQQIRETGRKDLRLLPASIVIGLEIDGIFVDVAEQEIRDLCEPRFGVSHRRRRIRIHRTEIALAVDERDSH
jgi:hypothetical protein